MDEDFRNIIEVNWDMNTKILKRINIRELMKSSGVTFGTSGTRGLVDRMTDEVCAAYVTAFIEVTARGFQFKKIALGMDLRPSSPGIAAACAQAIRAAGIQVDYCGTLPTLVLALYAQSEQIPAIMVTGSHIPFDRNGIKFYRPDGEISKTDELAIEDMEIELSYLGKPDPLPPVNGRALTAYEQRYIQFFPADMLSGKRLGLYEHSSVARDSFKRILQALGAQVFSLGRTEIFVPIDTEAVSAEDVIRGHAWSGEYGFDAIISTDGDGDRPLISDEQGNWLRGDIVGLVCARYLGVQAIAVPVSCNTAIEKCGCFESVLRTKIGSPYVIAGMQELAGNSKSVAGFEANGGFLLGTEISLRQKRLAALPTRDAVLPAIALLAAAREANLPISGVLKTLPARYTASDRLQNFSTASSKRLIQDLGDDPLLLGTFISSDFGSPMHLDYTDGLRITFSNQNIIHLRPSGNSPELRCYSEATSTEVAESITRAVLAWANRRFD